MIIEIVVVVVVVVVVADVVAVGVVDLQKDMTCYPSAPPNLRTSPPFLQTDK